VNVRILQRPWRAREDHRERQLRHRFARGYVGWIDPDWRQGSGGVYFAKASVGNGGEVTSDVIKIGDGDSNQACSKQSRTAAAELRLRGRFLCGDRGWAAPRA